MRLRSATRVTLAPPSGAFTDLWDAPAAATACEQRAWSPSALAAPQGTRGPNRHRRGLRGGCRPLVMALLAAPGRHRALRENGSKARENRRVIAECQGMSRPWGFFACGVGQKLRVSTPNASPAGAFALLASIVPLAATMAVRRGSQRPRCRERQLRSLVKLDGSLFSLSCRFQDFCNQEGDQPLAQGRRRLLKRDSGAQAPSPSLAGYPHGWGRPQAGRSTAARPVCRRRGEPEPRVRPSRDGSSRAGCQWVG